MTIAAGARLGRYEIRSKIGAGGMGEVYLAQDTELERTVALKILPADVADDKQRMQRFIREAKTASSLNHPNILTIFEIGHADSTHFIATEFIEGETLRQHIGDTRVKLSDALNVAIQAADALAAAHDAGIIHRDIKPENIMLRRRDDYVKVLDFGLAKLIEQLPVAADTEAPTRTLFKTEDGVVMGTATYMSPEQAKGLEVDARTDIWSLGAVIYEMVAGCLPFEGSTTSEVLAAIINEKEPPPLARFAREVPAELERIVEKALRKDRASRYQTIKDMLLDLRSLKQQLEFKAQLERSAAPEMFGVPPSGGGRVTDAKRSPPEGGTPNARPTSSAEYIAHGIKRHKRSFVAATLAILLLAAIGPGYWFFVHRSSNTSQIESIAVMPFVNASGNADNDYLSDGMTETLINSLSQLPKLNVKARSTVFRYKGREIEPKTIGSELSVQAILNGRVVQRGDQLTLSLELVDARNGNQLWGERYNRKVTDLLVLQSEIARDVSQKLRARLSGTDERKVEKNYTDNAEAYQLYLNGRYHFTKLTPSGMQTGIGYFQQAIDIDPSYALAYVGLADTYRSLTLAGDVPPTEVLPKAKAAAQKAVEIDDTLAEAHAVLGFILLWYDWDWKEAENQLARALELNPNSADIHLIYAHQLSNAGRHAEALTAIKRARELDPLNLRIGALEGQFLIHAGRADEALARLQKTLELDPNYWLAHLFASSAYIEKGMYAEAIAEARKSRELSGVATQSMSFLGYALAKSGKQAEARAVLEELLKLSKERYVPSYNIAFLYNGLGERDEALAWLERAYEQRDTRLVFLKVEPKWNNLRSDLRFTDLQRRIGF